jgi:hypothetical protein
LEPVCFFVRDIETGGDDVPHFGDPTAMLVSGGHCRPDMATGA